MALYQGGGLWREGSSIFPTGFDVAGFALAQGVGNSQLVSVFHRKYYYQIIVSMEGKRAQGFLFHQLAVVKRSPAWTSNLPLGPSRVPNSEQ